MSLKKVIFFKVQNQNQKLSKIVEIAHFHFEKGMDLTILVPDEKVQMYIDKLLWEIPDTSFLPHCCDQSERIQIMINKDTPFLQKHIFNLCSQVIFPDSFLTIYELDDKTSKEKESVSQAKMKIYLEKKVPIESYS